MLSLLHKCYKYDCIVFSCVAKKTRREGFLKDECWAVCVCAQSRLQQMCKELLSGSITIADIQAIKAHRKQMDLLCKENFPDKPSKLEVKTAIEQRLQEYIVFKKQLEQLRHLRSQIEVDLQCESLLILHL